MRPYWKLPVHNFTFTRGGILSTIWHWLSHVREYTIVIKRWYAGMLVRWYAGTLVRWYAGTLVRWRTSIPAYQRFQHTSVPAFYNNRGDCYKTLVRWSNFCHYNGAPPSLQILCGFCIQISSQVKCLFMPMKIPFCDNFSVGILLLKLPQQLQIIHGFLLTEIKHRATLLSWHRFLLFSHFSSSFKISNTRAEGSGWHFGGSIFKKSIRLSKYIYHEKYWSIRYLEDICIILNFLGGVISTKKTFF